MASPRFLRNVAQFISKGKGKHFDPFRTLLLRSYSFLEQFGASLYDSTL